MKTLLLIILSFLCVAASEAQKPNVQYQYRDQFVLTVRDSVIVDSVHVDVLMKRIDTIPDQKERICQFEKLYKMIKQRKNEK